MTIKMVAVMKFDKLNVARIINIMAFRQRLGEESEGGAGQAVELGALHYLSDGGAPEGPPCHSIPGYLEEDRETP